VLTCARKEEELHSTLREWAAQGLDVSGLVVDVSQREQAAALVDKAREQFGGQLHILVNNVGGWVAHSCKGPQLARPARRWIGSCGGGPAGSGVSAGHERGGRPPPAAPQVGTNIRKPTVEYSSEDFGFIMSTNLESGYALCQLCHPLLKAAGGGSIVFNSSVAGGPTAMRCGGGGGGAAAWLACSRLAAAVTGGPAGFRTRGRPALFRAAGPLILAPGRAG
jgi:Tropinone reductase 1